jgi:DNA-binding transcriptional MerR regulator
MQKFSIKAIERLSGIKAHTIRVWEQRYGVVQPSRKESKHRYYSNEDLKALLKVVFLYNHGYKIRNLAILSPQEIDEIVISIDKSNANYELQTIQMIESVMDYDEVRLHHLIDSLVARIGFEKTVIHVLFPLLRRLGILWMTNDLQPGQEHFASQIITQKLQLALHQLQIQPLQREGSVLLFAPDGEYHVTALLFMHYLLRSRGFHSIFLGANTPVEVVHHFYMRHHPTHFFVQMVTNLQQMPAELYARQLRRQFPNVRIFLSGPVARELSGNLPGCVVLRSDEELFTFCNNINAQLGKN